MNKTQGNTLSVMICKEPGWARACDYSVSFFLIPSCQYFFLLTFWQLRPFAEDWNSFISGTLGLRVWNDKNFQYWLNASGLLPEGKRERPLPGRYNHIVTLGPQGTTQAASISRWTHYFLSVLTMVSHTEGDDYSFKLWQKSLLKYLMQLSSTLWNLYI